jgi:2-polyprenyl-6-hydroxyphenyl methylase / 3-demethylubiquinone-9 3-methyltransferase
VTPNEFEAALERHRLRVIAQTGVVYDLLADRWQLAADMDVNYMLAAEKSA